MKTKMEIEQQRSFYEGRWERQQTELSKPNPSLDARACFTVSAIPTGCRSLLDVGCGGGQILSEFSKRGGCLGVALDLSLVALASVDSPKCCGSADQLPFLDRSFDVVLATEILEHIPPSAYPRVLRELARVTRKNILITVPNCENLNECFALCAACGAHFHVWGHVRSYNSGALESPFTGFRPIRIVPFGEPVGLYNKFLLWLRQKVAGAWYWEETTICYFCSESRPAPARWPLLARICDALNTRFWAAFFKRRSWLLALYVRQES